MNAKKSSNSRGKTRALEFHLYSKEFFFLSAAFSYINSETFLIIFYYVVFVFIIMRCSYFQNNECEKISKFEREDKGNGILLLHHRFFFFHENFPMNIQREGKVQHVLYGMRKRPFHGKSVQVPRKQRPTHFVYAI